MRLAVLTGPRRFTIADAALPGVGPGEVLLRVAACGVCASELDIYQGRAGHAIYPWQPGHEVSGVVERVADGVAAPAPGDPVAVWVTARGYGEFVAVADGNDFPYRRMPF
jgi:L-iditol 2-dehydrogenase